MRMWGFPTIKSRALGRVTATLKRLGFDRKPSVLCKSLFSKDSLERTYNLEDGNNWKTSRTENSSFKRGKVTEVNLAEEGLG